jgi:hypothetical protein
MPRLIDLTGRRFGRLVVLQRGGTARNGHASWWCRCDCGEQRVMVGGDLRSGATTSCGCLGAELTAARAVTRNATHGLAYHALYACWASMHDRCRNPNHAAYHNYGGRGIAVCDRWTGRDGFPTFLADMGERPEDLTLERIDNDGNYEPGNCCWATRSQQRRNSRPSTWVRGIRHGHAKLAEAEVLAIRASNLRGVDLADIYRVSDSTISLIRNRKTWRHLP